MSLYNNKTHNPLSGELQYSNEYSLAFVCTDSWSAIMSSVVCRELGSPTLSHYRLIPANVSYASQYSLYKQIDTLYIYEVYSMWLVVPSHYSYSHLPRRLVSSAGETNLLLEIAKLERNRFRIPLSPVRRISWKLNVRVTTLIATAMGKYWIPVSATDSAVLSLPPASSYTTY